MNINLALDTINSTIEDLRLLIKQKLDKRLSINGKSLNNTYSITLNKNDIGLSHVDNTSDANKPVSNATRVLLNSKVDKTTRINGQILDGDITLPDPIVGRVDNVDNTRDVDKPVSIAQQAALDTKANKSLTINSYPLTNDITINRVDIGLGNVDNTSDVDKPVSSATQSALNTITSVTDSLSNAINTLNVASQSYVHKSRTINNIPLIQDIMLTSSDIGDLINVDNTSDADKPVSIAQQAALDNKQDVLVSQSNIKSLNTASLLGSGDIELDQTSLNLGYIIQMLCAKLQLGDMQTIPITQAGSITQPGSPTTYSILPSTRVLWTDGNYISNLYLPDPTLYIYGTMFYAQVSSYFYVAIHGASNEPLSYVDNGNLGLYYTDSVKWYYLGNIAQTSLANISKAVPTSLTINSHPLTSDITLAKTDVGLANVDNTSDINKPISTLTQTALDTKEAMSNKNQANGYAGLDASSKLASSQLPALSLGAGSLTDVAITTPSNSQVLTYNGTQWTNAAVVSSGGGSGGLTSSDIVAGTGDGTSSVPDTTIRGAQASGANVQAGDLIIRAPGGTGRMGSGSIRFQTAAPLRSPYLTPFYGYIDNYTQYLQVFASSTSMTLYNTGKIANVLAIVSCVSNVTITSFTLGGIAHTPLYSQQVGAGRFIVSAFMNVPAANASVTCTVSSSTRISVFYCYFDPNDWDGTIITGQSSTPTSTAASVSFTDLLKGDLIFNCAIATYPWVGSVTHTVPGDKSFSTLSDVTSGGVPYVTVQCKATRVTQNQTSYTMTSTYSSNVTNVGHVGFYLRYKLSTDTTIPTFTDALVINPYGQMFHVLDNAYFLPDASTNLFNIPIFTLTAQSARKQVFTYTPSPTSGNYYRVVMLPDPRTLNIGCTFTITLPVYTYFVNPNFVYVNVYVIVPNIDTGGSTTTSYWNVCGTVVLSGGTGQPVKLELKACDEIRSIWEIDGTLRTVT